MRTTLTTLVAALAVLIASTPVLADAAKGRKLHDKNCTACHIGMTGGDGSILYTRKNRRVGSLDALRKQVRRCETAQELKWFDEDINSVVEYLNVTYYKFK